LSAPGACHGAAGPAEGQERAPRLTKPGLGQRILDGEDLPRREPKGRGAADGGMGEAERPNAGDPAGGPGGPGGVRPPCRAAREVSPAGLCSSSRSVTARRARRRGAASLPNRPGVSCGDARAQTRQVPRPGAPARPPMRWCDRARLYQRTVAPWIPAGLVPNPKVGPEVLGHLVPSAADVEHSGVRRVGEQPDQAGGVRCEPAGGVRRDGPVALKVRRCPPDPIRVMTGTVTET
jgi:hypothetical protein